MALGQTFVFEAEPYQADPNSDSARLDAMEQNLRSMTEEKAELAAQVDFLKEESRRFEEELSRITEQANLAGQCSDERWMSLQDDYIAGYENGILIRPRQRTSRPYSLRINHQNTFRFASFERDADNWTDSSGNVTPIFNSVDFSIPRGRLIFSGDTLMPNLSYLLNLDYNTVNNNPIGFRAYSLSYRFHRGLEGHVGQNKVPGSREWLHSSFDAQEGPDRSMATTFFRPSLSQGIWFTGEPIDRWRYHAMISNGFNTLNVRPGQLDDRFCGSTSVWWEPWSPFGRGYSDIENHRDAAIRLGSCLTLTREEGSQASDYPENALVRLSDGTLITQRGALAPGVTLQAFQLSLASVDVSFKYRGLSLATEIYRQELSSFRGSGPIAFDDLETYGGMAQGGFFIVPQRVETYSRNSFVTGEFGSGTEVAAGLNWFVLTGKSNLRYTADLAWLESAPADQNRTGFFAGQSGYLFRTQITSSF